MRAVKKPVLRIVKDYIYAYQKNNETFREAVKNFKEGKDTKEAIVSAMGSILLLDKEIDSHMELTMEDKNKIYDEVLEK